MPNCPTFIVYYFATLKAGGTVVNYNPLYTLEELTFQVKDSETELMVTLDLKLLFDKVEALMKAGTLKRAIVASLPGPAARRQIGAVQAVQGQGSRAPRRNRRLRPSVISDADVRKNDGKYQKRSPSIPSTTSPCCNIPAAPPARPKGAMLTHANVPPTASRAPPGRAIWCAARSACWRRCPSSTCSP